MPVLSYISLLLPLTLRSAVDDILMWPSDPAGSQSYLVYQTVWLVQHDSAAVRSLSEPGICPFRISPTIPLYLLKFLIFNTELHKESAIFIKYLVGYSVHADELYMTSAFNVACLNNLANKGGF